MTIRDIQNQAMDEWKGSLEIRRRYHTFEYYWWEQYARVYRLPSQPRNGRSYLQTVS